MKEIEEKKEKGMIAGLVEVFTEQIKKLEPGQAAITFIILSVIGMFGAIGFTSAIGSAVVKLIQVIGTIAAVI